jgi:hypothetical protein
VWVDGKLDPSEILMPLKVECIGYGCKSFKLNILLGENLDALGVNLAVEDENLCISSIFLWKTAMSLRILD